MAHDDARALESDEKRFTNGGGGESLGLDDEGLRALRVAVAAWRIGPVAEAERKVKPRLQKFTTWSGLEVLDVATPVDKRIHYKADLGLPGEYPFTRGVQPTMYRGKLWTMRMFAGFGTPEQTNQRFKYLLAEGQTGLSTAFDFPTLMGYDSDSPRSLGEVGMCGVAVDTLRDMEVLFDGIPLDKVTTSMTINGPAVVLLAFYIALADKRGIPRDKIGGTVQNDCLKEFIAQHAWVVGPRPAMRIVTDMIEFCAREVPRWNTVSISGYHIREAGATAAQELAFTIADGLAYVESGIARGLDVDDFAPRLSFFFDVHNDFFEEIAKFRAARRMWARFMRERYGARKAESLKLRTHAQTAGVSLTAQQPYNNVVRVALQALAAVLGGTQSLHTNSLDETYALPTEESVTIALRTQQIIAEESGVANTIDPLGGSYHVEWMTDKLEAEALDYIRRIDEMGGMVAAVEKGYPQREIAASAYRFQREVEDEQRVIVGVNKYVASEEKNIPLLKIDEAVQRTQCENLAKVKASRDANAVREALAAVREAARGTSNLMPPIIAAAKAYCTEQEICDVLREVMGTHSDPAEF
ncbi:methylmalonyl-CoA mutase family protein [Polyangium sp. y55x31]|uniref:acyl-CoA mutase large subunit family protein n=1 Tax=Polyangium sp. y55x31 TaxID=3042688 RepID=UPI002482AC2A|nr:methylmalonyl-CoA mutase family protein [Polyangium sp. y55x31]MDI1482790.1 methylmalonyl-CoA mutase family protein [Polyangium sp. y55x31]